MLPVANQCFCGLEEADHPTLTCPFYTPRRSQPTLVDQDIAANYAESLCSGELWTMNEDKRQAIALCSNEHAMLIERDRIIESLREHLRFMDQSDSLPINTLLMQFVGVLIMGASVVGFFYFSGFDPLFQNSMFDGLTYLFLFFSGLVIYNKHR